MKTNMAPAAAILLLVLALSGNSEAVQVQVEGHSFSLDDVRTLQALTKTFGEVGNLSPRMRASSYGFICAHPRLPLVFRPLCDQNNKASPALTRMANMQMDVCEICAFAACTGCRQFQPQQQIQAANTTSEPE